VLGQPIELVDMIHIIEYHKTPSIKASTILAIDHNGRRREEPAPGFVSLSAASTAVLVAVLPVSPVALTFVPVIVASAEETVTVCITELVVCPKVHVKVSPLTGLEMTPPTLERAFVPFGGMLLGL
jgi:hypothetical protein